MSTQAMLYVIVIPLAWLLFRTLKAFRSQQVLMLLTSYALYASWGLRFLGLLIFSSLLNYVLGIWLRRKPSAGRLWWGILLNLALLGTFKYLPVILPWVPHTSLLSVALANVALPVGISFWTFQALSYLFDVYREEELDPSLLEFLLYMSFWPTALSGPICRLSSLLPQFRNTSKPSVADLRDGLDRICTGLVMTAAGEALAYGIRPGLGLEDVFDKLSARLTGPDVWCVAIGYGFELFFNFAGYSHIVIGAARLFGFRLDENFDRPYLATSPSEFWRRWHMSLSFWIRDYLFLPVAVLRREGWWRSAALLISMITFGLWHKGSLLFALWGAYQGVLLVLHRQWQELQRRGGGSLPPVVMGPLSWLITFGSICLGWVFFRANSLSQALAMLRSAMTLGGYGHPTLPLALYLVVFASSLGYFGMVGASSALRRSLGAPAFPMEIRFVLYAAALYVGVFHTAQTQAFIYFQF